MPAPQFPQINNGDSGLTVRTTLNQVIDTFGLDSLSSGSYSHAEGDNTQAIGAFSHAEGNSTIASGSYQHVSGKYNTHGDDTSLFIIGNGVDDNNRSDIVRVTTTDVQVTGSLNVSGSDVTLLTSNFYVTDPITNIQAIQVTNGEAYLYDTAGTLASDINLRQLLKGDGTVAFDWENGSMTGSLNVTGSQVVLNTDEFKVNIAGVDIAIINNAGVDVYDIIGRKSIDAFNRVGFDTSVSYSIDWENRQLIKSDGTTVAFDWENGSMTGSLNVTGSQIYLTADDFRVQYTNSTTSSIECTSAGVSIFDTSNNIAGDFGNRILLDSAGNNSVNWNNRQLIKSDGTTVAFDWENGSMTGSLDVSGSATISNVLTLTPQDPLPSGVPTGSFAVSASIPPVPYFWDGSAWNALY